MIQLGSPKDIKKFIKITDNSLILRLNKRGLFPKYKDIDGVYFIKNEYENIMKG